MPTDQILTLLFAERDRLNRAIEALGGSVKRRGRPPKNPLAIAALAARTVRRRRKPRTAAQRQAHSELMKKYWAQRRKQVAKD